MKGFHLMEDFKMCNTVRLTLVAACILSLAAGASADDVVWDFEAGADHGFTLTSANPATPAPDDPTTAGDEAVTGVGGPKGLPDAGVALSIGRPDQFDGLRPPFQEGDKIKADGTLEYNQPGTNHPFAFPVNGRGQESYLSTYNLTQWGDNVHSEDNDQIAKSPVVLLGDGTVLSVWAYGGGAGTRAPQLDPNPAAGYVTGSAGVAVLSATDGSLLASVLTDGHGNLREDTIDLSAYAGQRVRIEVVDAFDGSWGWLAVDEIRITNAVSLGATPEQASAPHPADEATDVPLDVELRWTAGEYAPAVDGHQVYFGASFDDVNEGLAEVRRAVTSDPVFDTATLPFTLDFETTYYWRVDEANDATGWDTGQTWSFTTEPVGYPIAEVTATASSSFVDKDMTPDKTVDGSGLNANDEHGVENETIWATTLGLPAPAWIQYEFDKVYKLHEMWVWNANQDVEAFIGIGAKDVTVEYSLDGTDWTLLGDVQIPQASGKPDYKPEKDEAVAFDGAEAKFVRLTIQNNWGGFLQQFGLSEVRFFHVPVRAREPQPAAGATGVGVDSSLSWRAGREEVVHEFYLSTDEQAVMDGTAPLQVLTDSSFTPDALDYGKVYYWKVNEVNETAATTMWEGPVWSFSTAEFQLVDDFEAYNDDQDAGTTVFDAWLDGYDDDTNGSLVGHEFPNNGTYGETDTVHGGRQSMPLFYDNTGAQKSEATYTVPAEDWTANGLKSLSLFFHGDPDNTGELYVMINGEKVLYDGDASDIARAQWQVWNIDLSDVGTDVSNVTSLTVGVDDGTAAGVLYIDDIRLYPREPEVIIPVDPGANGLLAEYLFDNGATDTSGNGYHGTFVGDAHAADSVLVLDGVDDAVAIPRLGGPDATFNQTTYSMWMYSIREPGPAGPIGGINFDNWSAGGIHCKLYDGRANAGINGLAGGDMNGDTIVGPDEWVHLALTVTDTEATIYLNGQAEDSRGFDSPLTMILGSGSIGAWSQNGNIVRELTGEMNDVRIYDRAVSEAELLWLAGKTAPVHKPF